MGFNNEQIKAIQRLPRRQCMPQPRSRLYLRSWMWQRKRPDLAGLRHGRLYLVISVKPRKPLLLFPMLSMALSTPMLRLVIRCLADWKALGGRTVLIDAIKTAFHNLGEVLKPIKEAFRDIFPAATGRDLFDLTKRFKQFAEALKPSRETVDNLKRTFRGLFAILDIGKQISWWYIYSLR